MNSSDEVVDFVSDVIATTAQSLLNVSEAAISLPGNETTTPMPHYKKVADLVVKYMMGTNVPLIMLGMGCAINWRDIVNNFWPPIGILIGMCGQFIILPFTAFLFSKLASLKPYEALGALIVSCCPGGTFSNFCTYWIEGEIALSIVMTACSSVIALGAMPLNLYIYSSLLLEDDTNIQIPFWNIIRGLVFVSVPVVFGMLIRHCNVKIANKITRVTAIIGYVAFLTVLTSYLIIYYEVFQEASKLLYLGGVIMPVTGFTLAYLLAFLLRRTKKECRTIGVETGSQNMPIAMTIIMLSFDDPVVKAELLLFPTMYGVFMIAEIFSLMITFQCIKRYNAKNKKQEIYSPDGTVEEKEKLQELENLKYK